MDFLSSGELKVDALKMLVLDEADEMLSRGFRPQVEHIYGQLPESQTWLFSATLPKGVLELADTFMKKPTKILMKEEELSLDGLKQFAFKVADPRDKFDALLHLYETISITQCIIFVNRAADAQRLADN